MAAEKLSFLFEIDASTPGFDDLLSKLDKTNTKLKDVESHGKKAEHGFKGVGHAIDGVKSSLHHIAEFTGAMLLFEGIKEGIHLIHELGEEALNAAAHAERMDLSFELTLGREGAEDALHWVEQIANKTEFTGGQLNNWALQLANAGLKGEELKDTLAAALDVAGKRGPQAMEMAIDALSRAQLEGKIEGRALRGLGIPIADLGQLDQFKGLNEKQIRKKLETASIDKTDLLNLIAGADKLLGDKGVRAADTLGAKLTHLKDLPDQFFENLRKTDAFSRLSKAVDGLLEKLSPDSPAGQRISAFFEEVFGGGVSLVEKLSAIDIAEKIDLAIAAFKGLADIAGPILKVISMTIEGWALMIADITGHGDEMRKNIGKRAATQKLIEDTARGASIAKESPLTKDDEDAFEELHRMPDKLAGTMINGVWHEAGAGMGESFGEGVETGAKERLDIHSPSGVGEELGDMFAAGFGNATAGIEEAIASMSTPTVAGGPAMSVGRTISIGDIHIHVGGDVADPEETGRAAARSFRAELMAALEQAGIEGGAG